VAFERTVRTLRTVGRIEPQDAALVALGRTLAEIIDAAEEPVTQTAYAYHQVLRALRGEVTPATSDDDLAAFLAVLQGQMGDAPDA
jgi:recombinational DNA repair protein (RecF pathway)